MGLRDVVWAALGAVPPRAWHAFTWLGDSGLMLPAALFVALLLVLRRDTRRAALAWCVLFGLGGAVVMASKLAFMGWGLGSARFNFTGVSGHTAIGTSVWPVVLWLAAVLRLPAMPRMHRAAAMAGWALGAAIGVSRLALYAHSVSEVATGFVLGAAVSAAFLAFVQRRPWPARPHPVLMLVLVAPIAVLGPGTPAPTHSLLESIAMRLADTDRPFTRDDLYRGAASGIPPSSTTEERT
jgi:membrane-associated phospholipid phosphatase